MVDESRWELKLSLSFDRPILVQLSLTLEHSLRLWACSNRLLMKVDESFTHLLRDSCLLRWTFIHVWPHTWQLHKISQANLITRLSYNSHAPGLRFKVILKHYSFFFLLRVRLLTRFWCWVGADGARGLTTPTGLTRLSRCGWWNLTTR